MRANPNGSGFNHVSDIKLDSEIAEATHAIKTIGRRIAAATTGTGPSYDGNCIGALNRWNVHLKALNAEKLWRQERG